MAGLSEYAKCAVRAVAESSLATAGIVAKSHEEQIALLRFNLPATGQRVYKGGNLRTESV